MKPVSRVASIMAAVLFFVPVYSVRAEPGTTVSASSSSNITGPNSVCKTVTNSKTTNSMYVATTSTPEWVNFYTYPNAAGVVACPPPPPPPPPYVPPPPPPPPPYVPPPPPPWVGDGGDGCYVKGARVTMFDGSLKAIEDILPGEMVRGRYGEGNMVLALSHPKLGAQKLYRLNGEHYTNEDHPHWTMRGPAALRPEAIETCWGHYHPVILPGGHKIPRKNIGLTRTLLKLEKTDLLIGIEGLRTVASLEVVEASPGLQLYNLVLGGSHTYFVDGYLVTGWPREDDFDYDRWQPRGAREKKMNTPSLNRVA